MMTQADLKRVRALHQKKYRSDERRFLVQGRKVVLELLGSRLTTEIIYASDEAGAWLAAQLPTRALPIELVPLHQLERIGTLEKGNELVAVVVQPTEPPFRAPAAGELMLALDDIHDPRNMGGLLRIADWFGVKRLLCSPDSMEAYNPKVVQSSMGSLFRAQVRYAALEGELRACKEAGAQLLLASMDGTPIYDAVVTRPAVLVLGSESHGLSASLRQMDAQVVSIPRVGSAESLNVAMAAAALCTELARRAR